MNKSLRRRDNSAKPGSNEWSTTSTERGIKSNYRQKNPIV